MIENSNQPNRELAVAQRSSYLVGAAAGAVAGAVALNLYVRSVGFAAEVASACISGDVTTIESLLMTGATIGAIAGVIRTAVDRRWDAQKNTITKVAIDTATGFVAAPMATIGKCMVSPLFPQAPELWKEHSHTAQKLICSAIGGLTVTVIAPVGIVASTAARLANQYFAQ